MINFKTAIGEIEFPSNLSEISFKDYQFILDNTKDAVSVLCRLTSWPEDKIKMLDVSGFIPHLEFLSATAFDQVEQKKESTIQGEPIELKAPIWCEWGQRLAAQQNAVKGKISTVVAIYTQPFMDQTKEFQGERLEEIIEIIEKEPAEEIISLFKWIKTHLENMSRWDKRNLKFDPSGEQIRAGISNFNKLGDIPTIDTLAGGDVLKWEAVLKLPCDTIRKKLLLSNISSKFERKLSEIKSSNR